MAIPTTSASLSISRLSSRRRWRRRRASTRRAFWGVAPMLTGGRPAGLRPRRVIRVRVVYLRSRGPALALATLVVATRVVVMRRRISELHYSLTCSADPGGKGVPMSGAYAFTVLMFLRPVIVCRLTCSYPLLSFSVYRHSDERSGRPSWPMLWDLYPLHVLKKALRTRNMRVWR